MNTQSPLVSDDLTRYFAGRFGVLILDNEVTLDAFVTAPALPWARLTNGDGGYRIAEGYPTVLTMEESDREERNWDRVSNAAIAEFLGALDETVAMVVFGNNAGQGFPLAEALPERLRAVHGAVLFGRSLPERAAYEALGYRHFCPRGEFMPMLAVAAEQDGRPPALAFINTIEHNERNYHAPWPGQT